MRSLSSLHKRSTRAKVSGRVFPEKRSETQSDPLAAIPHGMWESHDTATPAPRKRLQKAIQAVQALGRMRRVRRMSCDQVLTPPRPKEDCADVRPEERPNGFKLAEIESAFCDREKEGQVNYATKPVGSDVEDGPVTVYVTCLVKDIGDVDIVNGTFFLRCSPLQHSNSLMDGCIVLA